VKCTSPGQIGSRCSGSPKHGPVLCSFGAHGVFGPYAHSSSAAFCQTVSSEVHNKSGAKNVELVYRIQYDLPLESLPDSRNPAVTMSCKRTRQAGFNAGCLPLIQLPARNAGASARRSGVRGLHPMKNDKFRGSEFSPPQTCGRLTSQNVSLNPSCITRLLPEPTSGLPAATSSVEHPQPNLPLLLGSVPKALAFDAPYGLAILG